MWTTSTTGLSLESLLTHEQDFFQGHAHGDGKLNIVFLKKLGMYAMAKSNMFRTMVVAFLCLRATFWFCPAP